MPLRYARMLSLSLVMWALLSGPRCVGSARRKRVFGVGRPRERRLELFERVIRPTLVEQCYSCHSAAADEVEAGLRVDHREGSAPRRRARTGDGAGQRG